MKNDTKLFIIIVCFILTILLQLWQVEKMRAYDESLHNCKSDIKNLKKIKDNLFMDTNMKDLLKKERLILRNEKLMRYYKKKFKKKYGF